MNLFSELQKYKPHEFLTPEENFFTESFKVILDKFPALARKIVGYLLDMKNYSSADLEFKSQQRHGSSCIIDLEVRENQNPILFIEIKIDSREGDRQLSRYCKLYGGKVKVVYLTKHHEEYNENLQISHFYWSQIYEVVDEFIKRNGDTKNVVLLKEFRGFMEEKDMCGFRGLKPKSNKKWEVFVKDVYKPHTELFKRIHEKISKKYICGKVREYFGEIYPQHYFEFYLKNKKKQSKNGNISPFCLLYLNSRAIASEDKDFLGPEGVFLSIGVADKKLRKNTPKLTKQIKEGSLRLEKLEEQWLAGALLEKIIGGEASTKAQLTKVYKFCDAAILLLNKEFKKQNIEIII